MPESIFIPFGIGVAGALLVGIAIALARRMETRTRERIRRELTQRTDEIGWTVVDRLPAWVKPHLLQAKLLDYIYNPHVAIIAVDETPSGTLVLFGHESKGIWGNSMTTGHVMALNVFAGLNAPAVELERARQIRGLPLNFDERIEIGLPWGKKWDVYTNEKSSALRFLSEPRFEVFDTLGSIKHIYLCGDTVVGMGGLTYFTENFERMREDMLKLAESLRS